MYYICSIYIDMIIGPEYSRYDRDPPVIDTDERAGQANPKRYADTPVQKYTLHMRYRIQIPKYSMGMKLKQIKRR